MNLVAVCFFFKFILLQLIYVKGIIEGISYMKLIIFKS